MTNLINWSADLVTGVSVIDDDHKKLVAMLNRLNEAMAAGKSKEVLAAILDELVQYTTKHFGHEEALMATHHYAGTAVHIAEHRKLVGEVLAFKDKLAHGKAMISIDLLKFLRDWLTTHILQTDKRLGAALATAGVH